MIPVRSHAHPPFIWRHCSAHPHTTSQSCSTAVVLLLSRAPAMDINSLLNNPTSTTIDNYNHDSLDTKSRQASPQEQQPCFSNVNILTTYTPSLDVEQYVIHYSDYPLENEHPASLSPLQQRPTENRIIGRMFRDRKRATLEQLQADVTNLNVINEDLRSKCSAVTTNGSYWSCLSAGTSLYADMYPISSATTAELGVRLLTGPLALALLEFVAERRNLTMLSLTRCTRARSSGLLSPTSDVCDGVVALAARNFFKVSSVTPSRFSILDMIFTLGYVHNSWAKHESVMEPFVFCLTAIEHFSALRPLKMVKYVHTKRCSRCGNTITEPNYDCCSTVRRNLRSPRGPGEAVFDDRVFLPS